MNFSKAIHMLRLSHQYLFYPKCQKTFNLQLEKIEVCSRMQTKKELKTLIRKEKMNS